MDLNLKDINNLQQEIMVFVNEWVHIEKTVVPRKEIISKMQIQGHKDCTVINALNCLLRKGYLRRCSLVANKVHSSYYVMLRGI